MKLELEDVKRRQQLQREQLELLRLMLPILMPEGERRHLLNLASGNTSGYVGNEWLRAELRRLYSIGLIEKMPNRYIGHLADGLKENLADYVRLTQAGEKWVAIIRQAEEAVKGPAGQPERLALSHQEPENH